MQTEQIDRANKIIASHILLSLVAWLVGRFDDDVVDMPPVVDVVGMPLGVDAVAMPTGVDVASIFS